MDTGLMEINDEDIKTVAAMTMEIKALDVAIEKTEEELKQTKENRRKIAEELLPQKMGEMGLKELKLTTGEKLTIKPFCSASLDKESPDEGIKWLEENGYKDVVKRICEIPLRKGADTTELCHALEKLGYNFSMDESVHSGTLSALVRERIENGKEFPQTMFKVYIGQRATIK